jgi:hypothetical protein
MKATVAIDEIDAPKIDEGQRVEFIFDAYPDIRYNGYVSSIPREARVTSNGIAVLDVELILTDPMRPSDRPSRLPRRYSSAMQKTSWW